jgi:hypothetical protein
MKDNDTNNNSREKVLESGTDGNSFIIIEV